MTTRKSKAAVPAPEKPTVEVKETLSHEHTPQAYVSQVTIKLAATIPLDKNADLWPSMELVYTVPEGADIPHPTAELEQFTGYLIAYTREMVTHQTNLISIDAVMRDTRIQNKRKEVCNLFAAKSATFNWLMSIDLGLAKGLADYRIKEWQSAVQQAQQAAQSQRPATPRGQSPYQQPAQRQQPAPAPADEIPWDDEDDGGNIDFMNDDGAGVSSGYPS